MCDATRFDEWRRSEEARDNERAEWIAEFCSLSPIEESTDCVSVFVNGRLCSIVSRNCGNSRGPWPPLWRRGSRATWRYGAFSLSLFRWSCATWTSSKLRADFGTASNRVSLYLLSTTYDSVFFYDTYCLEIPLNKDRNVYTSIKVW